MPRQQPTMTVTPHDTGSTALPDGRRIGWAGFGDPSGDVVFWFHGTPGARAQVPADLDSEAKRRRLRVIGVERPGTGDSTEHHYEQVVDFADDLLGVADELGIDRFAAVGLSGGGPFVLACAAKAPDRMTTGVVLGGVAPVRGPDLVVSHMLGLRVLSPLVERVQAPLSDAIGAVIRRIAPYGHPILEAFFLLTWGDWRDMRTNPDTKHQLIADLVDAARRSGLRAPMHDLVLFGREWGFELNDVKIPITFWGGTNDVIVPYLHAERQAKRVPGARLRTVEGRGHFAGFTNVDDVLDAVRAEWPVVRPAPVARKKAPSRDD